jgi:hypothetical protein
MYKWREKVLYHRKGIGFGHSMVYGLYGFGRGARLIQLIHFDKVSCLFGRSKHHLNQEKLNLPDIVLLLCEE